MKKTLLTLLITLGLHIVNAQTFIDAYDQLSNIIGNSVAISPSLNALGNYGEAENYVLESFITMYKATGNVQYLEQFVQQSKIVQDNRDDETANSDLVASPTYGGCTFTVNQPRPNSPTWSIAGDIGGCRWYPEFLESGQITFPMALYIHLVEKEHPNLMNLEMPINFDEGGSFIHTYGQYAGWLKDRVRETINFYNNSSLDQDRWVNNSNPGYYSANFNGDTLKEVNWQAAMGKTLLIMHLVTTGAESFNYLDKVKVIATHFKDSLTLNGDYYTWYHDWNSSYKEDFSHGSIEIYFAYLCYKHNISNSSGQLIFNEIDMNRFARTFTKSIYESPLNLWFTVFGDNEWYQSSTPPPTGFEYYSGFLVFLSEFIDGNGSPGRDIYNIISDLYLNKVKVSDIVDDKHYILFGFANLVYFQNILDPVAVDRGPGAASQWAGISCGDFDGNGIDEIVTVRNADGKFYITKLENHMIPFVASYSPFGNNAQWAGVAAGDFDNDGKDEFVAPNNVDGQIYLFKYNNSQISLVTNTNGIGTNSQWAGIAAGDFDGDGKDEFVAVRNSDGKLFIFKLTSGQLTQVSSSATFGSTSNWCGIASGDTNNDGKDDFAAIRNFDKKIYLFEFTNAQISQITSFNTNDDTWTGITMGDLDKDNKMNIIAVRSSDGNFTIYEVDNNAISYEKTEFFANDFDIREIANGNLNSNNPSEFDIAYIRNYDANIFVSRTNTNPGITSSSHNVLSDSKIIDYIIYPNPCKDRCIVLNKLNQLIQSIQVIDMNGKVQSSQLLNASSVTLNTDNLASGIYQLKIINAENYITFYKIVKL